MLAEDNPRVRVAGQFLEQLHQELDAKERIEIRWGTAGENNSMRRDFFPSVKEAAQHVACLGENWNVYAGIATRWGKNSTRKGVCRLQALWADLDAKAGYTRESRIEQLLELPHHPSILVWTGGWHPYFLLKKPAEGPEELDRAEYIMRRIAEGLGGDPVHDRSRILRMPGTYNWKYGEPRPVVIERFHPDLRYGLEELAEMAEALRRDVGDDAHDGGTVSRDVLNVPIQEGQRNLALTSIGGSLRDRGLDAETICAVLLEVNRRRCEPPLAEAEVVGIGRSIGRYPPGSPRYRRSSAIRVYTNRKGSS